MPQRMQDNWRWVAAVIVTLMLPGLVLAAETDDVVTQAGDSLQANQQAITAKETAIKELDQRIKQLQNSHAGSTAQGELIAKQLEAIKQELAKTRLELEGTRLQIGSVQADQKKTAATIAEVQADVAVKRQQLRQLIQALYEREQVSLIDVFLRSGRLGDLLAERAAIQTLQDRSVSVVQGLHDQEEVLLAEQQALVEQQAELGQLQLLQESQRSGLSSQQNDQKTFLAANQEEQARYNRQLAEAKAARTEIEQGLFELKGAGVKLSLTQATDMAKLAGRLTGVPPALILAVLKVESNVGQNVGSGTFPDDMQPASREPFIRIMAALGRDPQTAPISRGTSYGWGGAMGPAQIMPQTWEAIAPRIGSYLNKKTPDPYELTDAFIGTAILLGDHGAFDPARRREAVGRYLAGPNWERYSWYIDRVFAVAAEYAKEGL